MTSRTTLAKPPPLTTVDPPQRARLTRLLAASGMLPALVLLIIVGSALSPSFLTATNLSNVLRLGAVIGLLALGQTLVILSGGGGIDLSIASVASAAAIVGAYYQSYGLVAVIVASLAAGAFFGLLNGLGIALAGLQPFIVTLATMTIARGIAFDLTNAQPVYLQTPGLSTLSRGAVLGIPVPILLLAVVIIAGQAVLSRTVYGRNLYAVGGNEEAAHGAGINVRRYRIGVYVISGLLSGLAGLIGMAQLNTADPNFANGYELTAIAAVVVGGALLAGGRGTILGTLVGVLITALVSNLLNLLNVNPWSNLMVTGVIILVVVGLNRSKDQPDRLRALLKAAPLVAMLAFGTFFLYGVLK
ncbi:ABC transporter permease [Amycolatopsis sp. CA-161197]|uniref:ABC transporter permease n=1 Tax=Amycolatopsis sp. CA-161197 TaxID=3239922 RepID=UPI003D8B1707